MLISLRGTHLKVTDMNGDVYSVEPARPKENKVDPLYVTTRSLLEVVLDDEELGDSRRLDMMVGKI